MVGAVLAMTVMRVLLYVLDVSMLREYDGDGTSCEEDGEGVIAVSLWHEYVDDTRGSDIVSSAADVLGTCVVRELRGVCGVFEMCMCLARGDVEGEGGKWIR